MRNFTHIVNRFLLVCSFVPFIYIAFLLEKRNSTAMGFILLVFLCGFIGFYVRRYLSLRFLFIGNILSHSFSIFFVRDNLELYFLYQPFSPLYLTILLAILYSLPQLIGIFWATKLA